MYLVQRLGPTNLNRRKLRQFSQQLLQVQESSLRPQLSYLPGYIFLKIMVFWRVLNIATMELGEVSSLPLLKIKDTASDVTSTSSIKFWMLSFWFLLSCLNLHKARVLWFFLISRVLLVELKLPLWFLVDKPSLTNAMPFSRLKKITRHYSLRIKIYRSIQLKFVYKLTGYNLYMIWWEGFNKFITSQIGKWMHLQVRIYVYLYNSTFM